MKKFILIVLTSFILVSCASTGVKDETKLRPDSKDMANVYIKRQSGFLYSAVRAIIKLNGQDVASIYAKEFAKIYVPAGENMITIKADNGKKNIPKDICQFSNSQGLLETDSTKLNKRPHERMEILA